MDDYVKLDLAGDPEQANELRRLKRKRMVADMLLKQSMNSPQGQMIGNIYVPPSPMQGIAQLGQAWMGSRANRDADEGYRALGQRNSEASAKAIKKYQQGMTGTPEQTIQPTTPNDDQGNPMPVAVQPAQPATQEQKLSAIRDAIMGNNPRLNKMGQFDFQQIAAEQARKEAAQARLDQIRAAAEAKAEAQQRHAELMAAAKGPGAVTPVTIADPKDPNKTIVIDGRTNKVLGAGPKLTQTGAADAKLELGRPQAKLRTASMVQNLDRLDTAIDELDKHPGLSHITGTVAGRTPNLTNTATGAQAKLDSIKSQVFVSALQSMREASKTGGAVGNVSNREGDKLEATLGALSQAQSTDEFKAQLVKVKQQLKQSKELIQAAYDEQYGAEQAQQIPDTPPPGAVRRK